MYSAYDLVPGWDLHKASVRLLIAGIEPTSILAHKNVFLSQVADLIFSHLSFELQKYIDRNKARRPSRTYSTRLHFALRYRKLNVVLEKLQVDDLAAENDKA